MCIRDRFKDAKIPQQTKEAVYLGVENYGTVTSKEKESFQHRFFVDGDIKTYTIPADGGKFVLQNQLQEGYVYDITVKDEACLLYTSHVRRGAPRPPPVPPAGSRSA